MATFQKRSGSWRAIVRRKGMAPISRTFDYKHEAISWAAEIESEITRGVYISRAEAERTTLAEALERYIREYIPHLANPRQNELRVRAIMRRPLGSRFLASIRGKDIADFIQTRQAEGVKGNTVRLDLAVLSRLFEIAARDWGMESLSNPVRKVNKPKITGGRTRRLGEGEEEALLAAATPHLRPVIRFALETAMRRSEIASMDWTGVDLARGVVTLLRTKNGDSRTVPLSPVAMDILRSLPRNLSGSVFGYRREGAITLAFRRACAKAALEDLHFHDLRHEAVSRLFERTDLDVMEIRMISGHRTMQMLARYAHLRADRLVSRLAGARRGENREIQGAKRGRPRLAPR